MNDMLSKLGYDLESARDLKPDVLIEAPVPNPLKFIALVFPKTYKKTDIYFYSPVKDKTYKTTHVALLHCSILFYGKRMLYFSLNFSNQYLIFLARRRLSKYIFTQNFPQTQFLFNINLFPSKIP